MSEQKGRGILLAVGDGATSEMFNTLAGVQAKSISINNEVVDISNATDGFNRKLLDAGINSMSMTISGVFQDDDAFKDLEGYAFDGTIQSFELTWPNAAKWAFEALVASFEMSGEHNAEQTFSATLEMSGVNVIT